MQKLPYFFVSSKKPVAVLEHICEVRGVAADFAGTILAVRAQCVQHTTEAMLSKHERYDGLGMDALVINRMLSKNERYCVSGMDALVIVCSRNTNAIMVWAWMLW